MKPARTEDARKEDDDGAGIIPAPFYVVGAGLKPARTENARTENARTENARTENARTGSAVPPGRLNIHKYDPDIHRRRSIRLQGYDYKQAGAYFVTICTHNREPVLGDIVDGEINLNEYGQVVMECWDDLPNHYAHVELDTFIIMPNHVHGIIVLSDYDVGAGFKPALTEPALTKPARTEPAPTSKRHGLPEIVRAFKTFSSRHINQIRNTPGIPLWQRNYHERVVRNDDEMNQIREYIVNNPAKWEMDENNPVNL